MQLGRTPINISKLSEFLNLYPNRKHAQILLDGFSNGFRVNYEGPRVSTECNNLISAKDHEFQLGEKIIKEVNAGRIAGPFHRAPFANLRLSPVGLVPKKDGGWRMIQHLSYPQGSSVNEFIDPELATVQYTSFDKVLDTISGIGRGAQLARMDIKSAFRLLILHPDEFDLFGFKFKGQFFFDKCLPMGCSASCALFEIFSCFLEWTIKYITRKESIEHYLDDFLFVGRPGTTDCLYLMSNFRSLCDKVGVPLAEEKTIGPSCIITFLGLEIDTIEMVIRIPQEKLFEVRQKLQTILNKKKTTLKELQSLVGLLNFCARAIPSVRAFNRRFYDAMRGAWQPWHFIRVSVDMKEDILMWLAFIDRFNGCCVFGQQLWLSNREIKLYTDSAGNPALGCGVYFSGRWAFFQWPSNWGFADIMADITFLELVPIVLSVFIFKEELSKKQIVFYTDNEALVAILNKKTSKSKRVMQLIRPFVLFTMLHDMQFKSLHIEGRLNCIADSISRKEFWKLGELDPDMDELPAAIPKEFMELILGLKLAGC